jgi:tetraacyldisaccharide 4'-kinase
MSAQIISVGNLEVGGGGKTPFCVYLLKKLLDRGDRPVYLSRGYSGETAALDLVTVVPPVQAGLESRQRSRLRLVDRRSRTLARIVGDEGAVVAGAVPEVPLLFCGDKNSALKEANQLFDPSHVILDDAFQSWGVYRDVDIVLLDSENPLGNGRLIPAGSLRESPAALGRADWIGFNDVGDGSDPTGRHGSWLSEHAPGVPVFAVQRSLEFKTSGQQTVHPDDRPVAAVSSIARPEAFEAHLQAAGWQVGLAVRYPDHHAYRARDVAGIGEYLGRRGINRIVVTRKDWVKLQSLGVDPKAVLLADLELELVGAGPLSA